MQWRSGPFCPFAWEHSLEGAEMRSFWGSIGLFKVELLRRCNSASMALMMIDL